jgi:hypothetical protein
MEEPGPSRTEMAQALDETKGTDYEEVIIGWQQKLFSGVCAELFSVFSLSEILFSSNLKPMEKIWDHIKHHLNKNISMTYKK